MQITDTVHALAASKGTYVYLITGEETILIDTGLPFRRKAILKELRAMGIDPTGIAHILLTHHDVDHVGNAAMLESMSGTCIWASETDRQVILGEAEPYGFKKHLKRIFRIQSPRQVRPFGTEPLPADIAIIPTPGHTEGHVCFLYRDVLFAGDLLENKKGTLIPYPAGWNWDNDHLQKSVKKIAKYDFEWVCPAHGQPVRRGEQLRR
jgi:glyoxylase-like metal-dependent hydrolase (beta-lactamase superfamily II)